LVDRQYDYVIVVNTSSLYQNVKVLLYVNYAYEKYHGLKFEQEIYLAKSWQHKQQKR